MATKPTTPDFNVIIDTREKQPWAIRENCRSIKEVISRKLDVGDYAIEGLEDVLCIERKSTATEFANNVFEKRFGDVLTRMKLIPYRFMICEFDLQDIIDFPKGSDIPKHKLKKVRVSGSYMMRFLSEMSINYGIDVLFCGNVANAKYIASNIMRRIVEIHVKEKTSNNN